MLSNLPVAPPMVLPTCGAGYRHAALIFTGMVLCALILTYGPGQFVWSAAEAGKDSGGRLGPLNLLRDRTMTIRVLLADDHDMLRENVREFLSGQDGMEVVGEAVDGESVLDQTRLLQPDVVVMDISMPGGGVG